MTPRHHLDANVVLRFLLNDDPRQSPAAANLIANAKSGKIQLLISAVTIAEIFYVLARVYKHTQANAAAKLTPFVQSDVIAVETRTRVLDALKRANKTNIDFGDCYLAATAAERGDKVASFDGDLKIFTDIETIVPK